MKHVVRFVRATVTWFSVHEINKSAKKPELEKAILPWHFDFWGSTKKAVRTSHLGLIGYDIDSKLGILFLIAGSCSVLPFPYFLPIVARHYHWIVSDSSDRLPGQC